MKKTLLGGKPGEVKKKDAASATVESDAGDELGLRSKTGERLYRIYKISDARDVKLPQRAEPVDVVIGVANSKYTEIVKGPLEPGDRVVVRSLLADPTKP